MTPLYGRLCEIVGRRATMIVATLLFLGESSSAQSSNQQTANTKDPMLAGTALCAVAPSMSALIFARGIAGSGAGGLLTVTAIIVSDLVSLADRGLYQGGCEAVECRSVPAEEVQLTGGVNLLFGFGAAIGGMYCL